MPNLKNMFTTDDMYSKLSEIKTQLGFLPNLFITLSDSTNALAAYLDMGQSFGACDFSDAENEIIQLATSLENQCGYCVAGHSAFAANKNVPSEIIQDMRNDQPIRNPKLQALNAFTRAMVREQGHLTQSDFDAFLNAGYSKKQALEVILGISLKTFSNYTNNLINIKLDPMFQPHQWTATSANQLNNKHNNNLNTGAIK